MSHEKVKEARRGYKLAAPRGYHYLATFFSIQQTSFAPKNGWGMLVYAQDGHWLASFEVIPPPQKKVSFPAAKKMKISH